MRSTLGNKVTLSEEGRFTYYLQYGELAQVLDVALVSPSNAGNELTSLDGSETGGCPLALEPLAADSG